MDRTQADNLKDLTSADLVEKIREGNQQAEVAFYERYRRGLLIMLEQRTNDFARAEDLAQDTLLTVLNRLRSEGIEHPEHLNRFVQQTARFLFIGWLRKLGNRIELTENPDKYQAVRNTPEDQAEQDEQQLVVRKLISQMKLPRDRELLYRYYVDDQQKKMICDALELSSENFDRVIHRAKNRFKSLAEGVLEYE